MIILLIQIPMWTLSLVKSKWTIYGTKLMHKEAFDPIIKYIDLPLHYRLCQNYHDNTLDFSIWYVQINISIKFINTCKICSLFFLQYHLLAPSIFQMCNGYSSNKLPSLNWQNLIINVEHSIVYPWEAHDFIGMVSKIDWLTSLKVKPLSLSKKLM